MADAGRVIAGSARGIRLAAPGPGTRPLADRAKQTLFAILEPRLVDARVLDLFAGSGAAGIEALSRGAAWVTFVDRSRDACSTIVRNLGAAHLSADRSRIVCQDVGGFLRARGSASDGPFGLVILDPPYADVEARRATLTSLGADDGRLLLARAIVVTTHDRHHEPEARIGLLASVRRKRFGETMLTFYERRADEGGG